MTAERDNTFVMNGFKANVMFMVRSLKRCCMDTCRVTVLTMGTRCWKAVFIIKLFR